MSQDRTNPRVPAPAAWIRSGVAFAFVFGLGCALRLVGLGTQSLWFDECMTVWVARQDDLVSTLAADKNPPLAFWLCARWIDAFGQADATLRLLPALVSCLTLGIVIGASRRLLTHRMALLLGTLLAVSPFSIWYAQEVRGYALAELGAAMTTMGLLGLAQRRSSASWLASALGCAIGLGANYTAIYAGFSLLFVAAWVRTDGWQRSLEVISAGFVGFGIWIGWLLTVLPAQLGNGWGLPPVPTVRDLIESPVRLVLVANDAVAGPLGWLPHVAGVMVLVSCIAAALRAWRGDDPARIWLGLCGSAILGAYAFSVLVSPAFGGRYLVAAEVALLGVVATGLFAMPRRLAVAAACVLVAALLTVAVAHKFADAKEDFRSACAEIRDGWLPGDHIASLTGTFDGHAQAPLLHYLRSESQMLEQVLLEREIVDPPGEAERLHLVFREAPYSWPLFERMLSAWSIVHAGPVRNRVQYLLLVRRA